MSLSFLAPLKPQLHSGQAEEVDTTLQLLAVATEAAEQLRTRGAGLQQQLDTSMAEGRTLEQEVRPCTYLTPRYPCRHSAVTILYSMAS